MPETMLLIDPDPTYSSALSKYLSRQRLEIRITSNLHDAEKSLDSSLPDMIMADPGIPPNGSPAGDCVSMLKGLISSNQGIPVIIMADADRLEVYAEIFGPDVVFYLAKPVKSIFLDLAIQAARRKIGMVKEMNDCRRRIQELKEIRSLYQQLFDEVPCYISVQDRNFRLTATNRLFKRDFGSDIGEYCYRIYKHRESPCNDCPVEKTFEDGKRHQTEEVVTSKTGKQYHVLTQTAPIRDESGEISQVMEIATNITQIRELQDHLSSLGLMIGSVSHGVKGMLTALDGGLYQLETGIARSDFNRIKSAYDRISTMSERIRRMVLDILFYAKARKMAFETVDAAGYFRSISEIIGAAARKNSIAFACEVDPDLGEVELDTTWIQQTMLNLGENAVDACKDDTAEKHHKVEFIVRSSGTDWIEIMVRDNGRGMDTETRNKMFSLFFSSKGSRGTGIGLFIANHVIKSHGGSIEVESEPGKGSEFVVRLPRHPDGAA